jgi:hypothetical protein
MWILGRTDDFWTRIEYPSWIEMRARRKTMRIPQEEIRDPAVNTRSTPRTHGVASPFQRIFRRQAIVWGPPFDPCLSPMESLYWAGPSFLLARLECAFTCLNLDRMVSIGYLEGR